MSFPFIIWCRQRTGSISLFHSLCCVSEHTPAEIEPFDFGYVGDRQFTHVGKALSPGERDRELRRICDGKLLIKHCYENLSAEFNHALAEISTRAGYRHIHLRREDEVARLISKGIAERYGTWGVDDWTRKKYEEWKKGGRRLPPLDVDGLLKYHDISELRWRDVRGVLWAHEVAYEEVFKHPRRVLSRLADYVGLRESNVSKMVRELGQGQNTPRIWNLIPNVEELKSAVERSRKGQWQK